MSGVLENKVAIITGAGRGLGKAFALRFAQEGAKILLPDISLEGAEATAREITAGGGSAIAIETDISSEQATKKMAKITMDKYGKVDILLNNAAMIYGIPPRLWDKWTVEQWTGMFSVNVIGTWLCCKAIAPFMIEQSNGKIINIASDIPKVPPSQLFLPYACTKSAVWTLTQILARALGPSNINVNAIAPGRTATEASLLDINSAKAFDETITFQALKRREEPVDLVGTAVFLASKESDFITGQVIIVDGGAVML